MSFRLMTEIIAKSTASSEFTIRLNDFNKSLIIINKG